MHTWNTKTQLTSSTIGWISAPQPAHGRADEARLEIAANQLKQQRAPQNQVVREMAARKLSFDLRLLCWAMRSLVSYESLHSSLPCAD